MCFRHEAVLLGTGLRLVILYDWESNCRLVCNVSHLRADYRETGMNSSSGMKSPYFCRTLDSGVIKFGTPTLTPSATPYPILTYDVCGGTLYLALSIYPTPAVKIPGLHDSESGCFGNSVNRK